MLQNFFKKFAAQQWEIFSYKDEWSTVILFVIIAKILTCAVSIFSGYAYLNNFLFGCLNNETAALIFSIIILLIIEGLNWFLLDKTFKFMLRAEYKTALLPSIFATAIFILSFNLSANGIAIWKAEKADLSNDINAKFTAFEESARNGNAAELAEIDQNIADIKANPEQWSNGKRCVLSAAQNSALQQLYDRKAQLRNSLKDELKELEADKKNELAENATNTTDQANKFYTLVAAIMIAQFLCNLYLMYSWKKIHIEENPEQVKAERINMTFAAVGDTIDNGIESVIEAKRTEMDTMFALMKRQPLGKLRIVDHSDPEHQHDIAAHAPETAVSETETAPENTSHNHQSKTIVRGFGTDDETAKKTPENAPQQNTPETGVPAVFQDAENAVSGTPKNAVLTIAQNARKIVTHCQYENCKKPLSDAKIAHGAKYCNATCKRYQWNLTHPKKEIILAGD